MDKLQKIIVASLLSTAGLSWLLSATQPDMMNVMMTYNPVLVLLFTASWTAGMAAMMFPAIVPMVLLYNRLITNKPSQSSTVITEGKFSHTFKMILCRNVSYNLGTNRDSSTIGLVCSDE
jgi:hypothetical protein